MSPGSPPTPCTCRSPRARASQKRIAARSKALILTPPGNLTGCSLEFLFTWMSHDSPQSPPEEENHPNEKQR